MYVGVWRQSRASVPQWMKPRSAGCSPGRVNRRASNTAAASRAGPEEERYARAMASIRFTSGTASTPSPVDESMMERSNGTITTIESQTINE